MRNRHATKKPHVGPRIVAAAALIALGVLVWMATRTGSVPSEIAGLAPVEAPPTGVDLGTFDVDKKAAVDGDTLRLQDGTRVRVLGLDAEELFHGTEERREAARDFDAYARRRQGDGLFPVKYGTPAGEEARAAVRRLLRAARRVRLERDGLDAPTEDTFGRTLAHVVLQLDEGDFLLSEVLINAGHSPYFVKYGRSRRFDDRLRRAETAARDGRRGVWAEDGPRHYPDYDERLAWWHARADQVDRWRSTPPAPDRVDLESPSAPQRLRELVGAKATVFGLVRASKTEGRPYILWLRHRPKNDFAIVFFDDAAWRAIDLGAVRSRFVTATGSVTLYRDRPQIVVTDPSQVRTD